VSLEDIFMNSAVPLLLVARITYYLGWITTICGGVVHFLAGVAAKFPVALAQRNLFEASVLLFIISIASATLGFVSSRD